MQNRYSGDIGDYVKLAILRHFAEGRRLGVAWWLFPDELNGDGRHIGYLTDPDNWERYDPALFRGLSAVVKSGKALRGRERINSCQPARAFRATKFRAACNHIAG